MNVLHLATTYPLHAGDSNAVFVEALAESVAGRGHQVDVLLPAHPALQIEQRGGGVRLHAFRYSPCRRWHPWGYAQALTADRALRWDAYAAALPATISAARAIRRILSTASVDLVHAHWLLPNGPIVAAALRGCRQPFIISCHGSGVFLCQRHRWAAALARRALRSCSAVTACSRELADRVERLGAGPEVEWIPYGVDTALFTPLKPEQCEAMRDSIARRHGLSPQGRWILAVGRLVPKKGFDQLVAALPWVLSHVPSVQLLIAGAGPMAASLRQQAAVTGVEDRVHLLGPLAHQKLPDYYAAADVVAVPSVHGPGGNVDGLPNTFLEALASGAAVVASRVGGIPDVARDGETVVLVPEEDIGSLAAALSEVLTDEKRCRALSEAARADAERHLGWEEVARRFEQLYFKVLGR
ncbi:MAG: glycosyltransferase family 4 protein [Acidobacteriota bacterium]